MSSRSSAVLLVAGMTLAACAADEVSLAPAAPERPWVIPRNITDLPKPGSQPGTPTIEAPLPVQARGNAVEIDPARKYDLAGLIDLAQRNNPETSRAWEEARQAALGVGLAETSYVPQVTAEIITGFQHTPLPIPTKLISAGYFTSNTRELVPTLAAKWLLFDFGQREGEVEAAKANSFVANVAFTGAHQKLIYAVSRDYFALGAARGRLRVAKQTLETAQVVQDSIEQRRAHELATVVQTAQARRQTAQARFKLEASTGADHAAYAALIASMGIAPSAHIEAEDSSELPIPAAPSGDLDRLIAEALAQRPDIVAALGKVKAAEARLDSARATYYPTIGVAAEAFQNIGQLSSQGSRYYSVNEPGANILLKLSLPLYDGGARDAKVAIARSEVAATRHAVDQARDQAVHQVTDAYDALRTSLAEYTAALAVDEAAQTAFDASLEAYRHGVGTYTDVVNGQTALSEAQSEKEDAHANIFTAAAALAFATGAILAGP